MHPLVGQIKEAARVADAEMELLRQNPRGSLRRARSLLLVQLRAAALRQYFTHEGAGAARKPHIVEEFYGIRIFNE